jgi:serine/threonine protein kinase
VAEERESKGKLPRYPGLERYTLLEKMGDGAFSNVYRARDNEGQYPEVAIKVVRKFEMNSTQVCCPRCFTSPCTSHQAFHSFVRAPPTRKHANPVAI